MTGIRSLTITMALCMAAASAFASARELLSLPVAAPLRANTQMGDFRTSPQPFPDEHGRIVLKARLRTVGGIAKMNIHLVGDGYAWRHSREIEVAEVPQTFTVEGEMPRSIAKKNEFFVRLDPPATPVFVESVSVSWLPVQTAPSDGREKLVNADFEGGAWGYMRYVPAASTDSRVRRAVVSGGRARPDNICFRSFSYPIVHGRDSTVAVRVRSLDQTSPAEVSLMMIDNAWHIKRKVQTLSEGDWHDIRFSCRMEPSTYNRGYVRVDAKGPGIEIDRMSLAEGVLEGYPPFIDGEILPGGQTLFDSGNHVEFLLRRRNVSGKPGKTKIRILDARGEVVRQIDFAYGREPFSNLGIAIPADHPKGLFEVEAPGVPRIRYAVAENLASRRFSFNP